MKYQDHQAQTCDCVGCCARISMNGDKCFAFGLYLYPDCREQRELIEEEIGDRLRFPLAFFTAWRKTKATDRTRNQRKTRGQA